MTALWGIDLGGSKIEGVVADPANFRQPIARFRHELHHRTYAELLSAVKKLVDDLRARTGMTPHAIGLGTPGILDRESGALRICNLPDLNSKPFRDDLSRTLGVPVIMENDANCFALAEASFGAARGAGVVFGAIVGTGIGGGIIVNGRALSGINGFAGEWGHTQLVPDGAQCGCGARGCVEALISGPALEAFYQERSGKKLPMDQIARLHDAGDTHAGEVIERLMSGLGRALSLIIHVIDPDVVVLGGGLSNIDLLYTESLTSAIPRLFNLPLKTRVVKNELGDSAGVFGAALLTR